MIAGDGSVPMLARSSPATRLLAGLAGAAQLAGLAIVLGGGPAAPAVALVVLGVLLGVVALAPSVAAGMRRNRGWIVFAALVLAVAWWADDVIMRVAHSGLAPLTPMATWRFSPRPVIGRGPLVAAIAVSAAGGLVLIADAVRVWLGMAPHQRAPWRRMTEVRERPEGMVWRGLAGAALVALAAVLAVGYAGRYANGNPGLQVIVLMLVAIAAACVAGAPIAVGSLMRVDRDKAGSAREVERQRFAAHLHDSVLQTLALVQRQAQDPVAVARLARRQEYALRAWMAGEAELLSETVGAALRDAVATVEDEHGITVELTAIGDRPLDPAGEALVAAAREALRNAARHAAGAPVFVFAEMTADGAEVFVRDEGPGFDVDAVPAERRGIRDAIIGRMGSAGGAATVESVAGDGTEVALRIRRSGRNGR